MERTGASTPYPAAASRTPSASEAPSAGAPAVVESVAPAPAPAAVKPPYGPLRGLLKTARPRQWVKNVLVFAAPGAAGRLLEPAIMLRSLAAFGLFTLAAAGTYLLNDAFDVEADRQHPDKCHRPIAAGIVPVKLAAAVAAVLLALAVGLSFWLAGWSLALVLGLYVILMLAYSSRLKHVPVVELVIVASGFVFRAIAGGLATDVVLSDWFLIVTSFASLFLVAGKRYAEHEHLGENSGDHRRSLDAYTNSFLRYVVTLSSSVAIVAYCLWTLAQAARGSPWFELSIVPFVLGLLHYALRVEHGEAGAPEEVILRDRTLQIMGLAWALLFAAGVYLP